MNSYLVMASKVLAEARRPLSAREILAAAYRLQLVPQHLYGKTQHKTLQARLAEDILLHRARSEFVRTAPGRFLLRQLLPEKESPRQRKREYVAAMRAEQLKRFDVLCFDRSDISRMIGMGGVAMPTRALDGLPIRYKALSTIKPHDDICVARLIILPFRENQMLFRRNEQSITVGVSSYIKRNDKTLFSKDKYGIEDAARRALVERLCMSPNAASSEQFGRTLCSDQWLLKTDMNLDSIAAIVTFHCTRPLEVATGPDAEFYWHENFGGINDLSRFDVWSQAVLQARLLPALAPTH